MRERESLLKRIAAIDFAVVELNLYMDTHPYDLEMNDKLNSYKCKSKALKKEFSQKFGPISSNSKEKNRWGWISSPWPWEIQKED